MANGASRLFEVMKNTSEGTNNMPSQVVSLTIKSVNPLILIRDDRLEIPAEFCIIYKNLNINSFRIGDIVTAIVLNNSQQYLILSNDTAEEQGANYEDLSNKPKINNVTLIGNKTGSDLDLDNYTNLNNKPKINNIELSGNKTSSDLNLDNYNDMNNKPSINNIELTGNKTSSDLNLDNYNNMQNKPQINGVELSGNKSAADLNLVNTSTLQQAVTNLENKINDKNIITVKTLANYTIQSTDTAENVKTFSLYNSTGNKLTVQNGVIKIGSGVSKVKVSYNATCQNSTSNATSRAFTYLMHNNTAITQESHYFNRTWEQISASHNTIVRNVSQGDEFYLRVYGLAGINLMGGSSFCHTAITVEVVE